MNKKFAWFGFLTGMLCVSFLMLLLYLGFQLERKQEEEAKNKPAVVSERAASRTAGATLTAIDGPPTEEKIAALLSEGKADAPSEGPTEKTREVKAPQPPSAFSIRRSAPIRQLVPGKDLELYLHISKREEGIPDSLVIRDELPSGWALKEVARSTTPMTQIPESGKKESLEFRWEKPYKFPITVKYSVQVSEESEAVSRITGDATWVFDGKENTSTLAVLDLYAAPAVSVE